MSHLVELGFSTCVATVLHPFVYAKTLIQIGYEPLPAYRTKSFLGRPVLAYPGVHKYMYYIYQEEGFLGLYRGLLPKLAIGLALKGLQHFLPNALETTKFDSVLDGVIAIKSEEKSDRENMLIDFLKTLSSDFVTRLMAIIITQPLHVVMVRSMAQFVGKETTYNGIIAPFTEIIHEEGLGGLFVGFMPRLIGEMLCLILTNSLQVVVINYFSENARITNIVPAFGGLIVNHLTYPFMMVANNMAVTGSNLAAGNPPNMPNYHSWVSCWKELSRMAALRRGSSFIWRMIPGIIVVHEKHLELKTHPALD